MFTGLVEAVGTVARVEGRGGGRLLVIKAGFAAELKPGDSVAVDGTCLTVVNAERQTPDAERRAEDAEGGSFAVEAVGATLAATTLAELRPGEKVNLERALAVGDRMGGHMVQGHVDEVGKVRRVEQHQGYRTIAVSVDRKNDRLIVERGSIGVNGVSLTIAASRPGEFSVNIIPHTWDNTNLSALRAGRRVNIEYDLFVKALAKRGP